MAKMRIAKADRPRVKLECLRMIVHRKLDPARATLIPAVMDSYLKLTAAATVMYTRWIETIDPKEREVFMEWTNEWIEKGKAKGLRASLDRRLPEKMHPLAMDALAEDLLDFKTLGDARRWIVQHA